MARSQEQETEAQTGTPAPPPGQARGTLGVGMVGYAFMGAAHSQGWRTAGHVFDLPVRPALAAICGRDRAKVDAAAA
ncbi:gfo/Idh/MocA family oxidoreductase, partial [Streptomyces cavourensis]